jgi:uncharacterized protein (TIGR02145 family)
MRYLITIVIAALSLNAFGQVELLEIPQVPIDNRHKKLYNKLTLMGGEIPGATPIGMVNGLVYNSILQSSSLGYEEVIGVTQYDLQSNASIDDRLVGSGNAMSAGWNMSLETGVFPDRGTGYNFFDGSLWGEQPYERIESVRCGWPSIAQTGSGLELSITHPGIDTPFLMTYRTAGSGDAWNEVSIPMDGPSGVLWPRVATSGPDGNTIHVIGVSTPIANGGALYEGQDGALLYYRSLNAGFTWEQSTFPALDTANFVGFGGDSYAIHARDGVVAFAVFNDLMDTFVMISEDNGDNWEYTPVIDFPIDNYVIDMGLPVDGGEDFNGDGIFQEYLNSDGAGDVHVDQNGLVHVVFGGMYYMDADTVDNNFSNFPRTNGLEYWNQSFGIDSSLTIAYAYDIDESGALDLEDDIAQYFVSLAGIPSMGSSEDGRLYVSYSAIMENFSSGDQNYRHIYVVQSSDGGNSWNSGTACDLTPDNDFDGLENVFASMNPNVGDTLELIYQRDFEPGLHVRGDLDPLANNDIVSLRVPISWLDACAALDGCTNANACNYNPSSIIDDGTCEYISCLGCTTSFACNYEPEATIDDGSCEFICEGCTDEGSCNYDPSANVDDSSCEYLSCAGCTDTLACNFNSESTINDGSCIYPEQYYDCFGGCINDIDSDGICDELEIPGCTDEGSCNYATQASEEDGSCESITCAGCQYEFACNYDPDATIADNESCEYGTCPGCTDSTACNYNPTVSEDDGSCSYNIDAIGICGGSCASDSNNDGICDIQLCPEDLNGDGVIGVQDLLLVLSEFGCASSCENDINQDGYVAVQDILLLLSEFGNTCEISGFQNCGDLIEHDGYDYSTVLIGDQCWFSENCRYLPVVSPSSAGSSSSSPYYYVYDYEGTDVEDAKATENYVTYGVLYNWPAVMTEGVCPTSWHIPSDAEWMTLEMYLGMSEYDANTEGYRGTDEGDQMKSTSGWANYGNGSNSSGLTALPGGLCRGDACFNKLEQSNFWSSSSQDGLAWMRDVVYDYSDVTRYNWDTSMGFSARCIKD